MIDLIGTLRGIRQRVDQIFALVNSMLVLKSTSGTLTTDGTEQTVYINNAPQGVWRPEKIQVDFSNNTAAESIRLRVKYRINPAGGLVKKNEQVYSGAQDPPLKNLELEPNRYGIEVTLERLAGGALTYDWAVFYGGW